MNATINVQARAERNGKKFLAKVASDMGAFGNFSTTHAQLDTDTLLLPRVRFISSTVDSFIRFIYQVDDNGIFIHLVSGSMIPSGVYAPWGSSGGRTGLTRRDRDILSLWWKMQRQRHLTPFFYDPSSRRWYVDSIHFPTVGDAVDWWTRNALTVQQYATVRNRVRGGR